jgi:cytochrome d ubiquinol oxidase subunit II
MKRVTKVSLEMVAAFVLLLVLSLYVLTGVADFGAGFWQLVFRGERNLRDRQAISTALAPIWEANHVWLVVAIVLISGAFPKVLATLSVALDVPLLLMLIGVSLRGSAFAFRRYGPTDERFQARWGLVFGVASTLTPVFLGIIMGTAVSGSIRVLSDGSLAAGSESAWFRPFPILVGIYTFAIGAFLSAVYLSANATASEFQETFRKLAIAASVFLAVVALGVLLLSRSEAPIVFIRLTSHVWSWPFHLATAFFSALALLFLSLKKIRWARAAAVLEVLAIMIGLGLAQYPYLVTPDLTLFTSASPRSSLRVLLIAVAIGMLLVVPGFVWLYWVFQFRDHQGKTD